MPKPASPQFLSTLGRTIEEGANLQRQGRLAEAEKIYARILKTLPDQFETLQLFAELKMQRGKPGEALRLMTAAVAARPQSADARLHLGHVLRALKQDAEALANYQKALAIDPHDVEALGNCGDLLLAMRRPAEALACFEKILAGSPGHPAALSNRAVAFAMLDRQHEALADFEAVIRTAASPMTLFNYGKTLAALERHGEAIAAYDRALAMLPNHVGSWSSRGVSLQALNRHADAIASFDKALAIDPDYADAHLNKALALLAIGDYPAGQFEYEWRWKRSGAAPPRQNFGRPMWRGDHPLQGRTILLHAEQGLGDTIQFVRYVAPLARSGAKVVLEVHPELKRLLARLPGCDAVIAFGEPRPAFDVHCPLGSLPLAFKTVLATVPAEIPYLSADAERMARWRPRLEALRSPRVGLVWAGNPAHPNDRNRSVPLAALRPLWETAAGLVSLQRDLRDGDVDILAASGLLQVGGDLVDFDDTAAILALCDLVIAVDTSVAHLAAAMGRPLWLMLPFSTDWRWTAASEANAWYPAVRQFRQPRPGDWDSVVARVADALAHFGAASAT